MQLLLRRFEILNYGPDAEADPATFDVEAFIERAVDELGGADIDGVVSSSDYPGCLVAAIIAERLGLPGPEPVSLLRASHKYYSRLSQAASVPDSTPEFALIDPRRLDEAGLGLGFPLFIKPIKSWFSQFARRVGSFTELTHFLAMEDVRTRLVEFTRPFNTLPETYGDFEFDATNLIAEEILEGQQVTLEGYVVEGATTTIGVVDSTMYPGTSSFESFTYPSRLDSETVGRMSGIADLVVRGLGYTHGLFNIEFMYNQDADTIHVIEINPRMCGQFADLMQSVNGVNTYEILFDVGLGRAPAVRRPNPEHGAAASYALRSFRDGIVRSVPNVRERARLSDGHSVTLFITYYLAGQYLSSNPKQYDGWSYRYAVINVCGADSPAVRRTFERARDAAGLQVET